MSKFSNYEEDNYIICGLTDFVAHVYKLLFCISASLDDIVPVPVKF